MEGFLDPRTALPALDVAAHKAIALDDTLAQTHLTLAAVYWLERLDFPRALQELDRAIQIDPEFAEAYLMRAWIFGAMNRHAEAIDSAKKAMEVDPFARLWAMAQIYNRARQYDRAITDASQRLESTPNDAGLHGILSLAYLCRGKTKEGMRELERNFVLTGDNISATGVRRAFEQGGYRAVVQWQIRDLEHKSTTQYVSPVWLADLYGQLGQRDKTLALLEEAYSQHSPHLLDIQNNNDFDFLHSDEHYRSLIRRVGLPPAW